MPTNHRPLPLARSAAVAGPVIAFVIGAASSSVRSEVGSTNIGIALSIVVVVAGLVGRLAALTTAVAAAATFNFFHTEPYHSLHIRESGDALIVGLLVLLGFVVSDVTAWLRRRDVIHQLHRAALGGASMPTTVLATAHPVRQVWPELIAALLDEMAMVDVQFVARDDTGLAIIHRNANPADPTVVLPAAGASVAVMDGPRVLGHLLLVPRPGPSAVDVDRRLIVALADHVAIALTPRSSEGSPVRSVREELAVRG